MNFRQIISERAVIITSTKKAINESQLTAEQRNDALAEIDTINRRFLTEMEDENDAMYACFREGRQRLVEIIKSGKGARAEHNARQQFYADCDRRRAQNETTITRLFEENRKALEEIQMRYLTES